MKPKPGKTTTTTRRAEKAAPAQPKKVEKVPVSDGPTEKAFVPPPPREAPKAVISTTKKLVKNVANGNDAVSNAPKEPTKSNGIQGEIPMSNEPK